MSQFDIELQRVSTSGLSYVAHLGAYLFIALHGVCMCSEGLLPCCGVRTFAVGPLMKHIASSLPYARNMGDISGVRSSTLTFAPEHNLISENGSHLPTYYFIMVPIPPSKRSLTVRSLQCPSP